MKTATFPIAETNAISLEKCKRAVAAIDALKSHWIQRNPSFYTLGAAAYIDAPDPHSARSYGAAIPEAGHYQKRLQENNPLLEEHFSWLYQDLIQLLETMLGQRAKLTQQHALPGFHIFLDDMRYANQSSHVPHYDRPFGTLEWPNREQIDFQKSISYTLTLELPKAGGGLKLWDVDYYEMRDRPKEEIKQLLRSRSSITHPYVVGGLICHSGNELHQISPWTPEPGDRRITLQGHGLFHANAWELYF